LALVLVGVSQQQGEVGLLKSALSQAGASMGLGVAFAFNEIFRGLAGGRWSKLLFQLVYAPLTTVAAVVVRPRLARGSLTADELVLGLLPPLEKRPRHGEAAPLRSAADRGPPPLTKRRAQPELPGDRALRARRRGRGADPRGQVEAV